MHEFLKPSWLQFLFMEFSSLRKKSKMLYKKFSESPRRQLLVYRLHDLYTRLRFKAEEKRHAVSSVRVYSEHIVASRHNTWHVHVHEKCSH